MKFFTAVQFATFAESAFKSAGLDLEAAQKAGNVDVIKAALEAAKAPAADAGKTETILAAAVEENKQVAAELATAKTALVTAQADAAKFSALSAAVTSAGFNIADLAKLKEQIDAQVAKDAAALVAKSGHAPIDDQIIDDQTKKKTPPAAASTLTGRDRLAADFHAQAAALNGRRN